MFIDTPDHFAINKGTGRSIEQIQLNAALFFDNADLVIRKTAQQLFAII